MDKDNKTKWHYYNHALIPNCSPYIEASVDELRNKQLWKLGGGVLFARWTTDFDCGYETNWWYVVKDKTFNIASLKAKRRYEINKGIKNFEVKPIDPCEYKEELYRIQIAAFSVYPKKYRPTVDKKAFINGIAAWKDCIVLGAFFRESYDLVGYVSLSKTDENFINFNVLKSNPKYEKWAINAALVEKIMEYFEGFLVNGGTICDGERCISHETKFQDYLEKYFGFRKAYCHLHIRYNPKIKWLIKLLYPVRGLLKNFDEIKIVHQINSVLKMEEICRSEVLKK